ncbi:MAG: cation:proton antiporter [Clostridium sp.]
MIKLILAGLFLIAGLIVLIISSVGNYRFSFILNRMQVSSISDTLGAMFIIVGLIILSGFNMTSLKLVLMILFMWFANPVASHFLAKTEVISNDDIINECEVVHHDDI